MKEQAHRIVQVKVEFRPHEPCFRPVGLKLNGPWSPPMCQSAEPMHPAGAVTLHGGLRPVDVTLEPTQVRHLIAPRDPA